MISGYLFHFIRPEWLLALFAFFWLFWRIRLMNTNKGIWQSVCDQALLPHILIDQPLQHQRWPWVLYGISGVLAIIALAGPTWERLPVPVFRNDSALVIVLDLSRSMDATDIKPSRLERARFKITDILKGRKEGQTALIVYAGDAFVVTPLTDDTETIRSQLSALSTVVVPTQGSQTRSALNQSVKLLQQAGLNQGAVLLITDGIDVQASLKSVKALRDKGYRLSVLGVGTVEGAPIPLPQGGFFKDRSGSIVIPGLNERALRDVAEAGGGLYQMIRTGNTDLDALSLIFDQRPQAGDSAQDSSQIDQWYEAGPWLLLILLPIAALTFRRGYLWVLMLCIVPMPDSYAFEWQDLWVTPDQQGYQTYQRGDNPGAAKLFKDNEWKAAAQYKAGQYQQVLESLEGIASSDGLYNKGNALARLGRYQDAVSAYKSALQLDPDNTDAQSNKATVEELLQQQEQEKKQDNSSEQEKQDSESKPSEEANKEASDQDQAGEDNDQQSQSNQGDKSDEQDQTQDSSESQPEKETKEGEQEAHADESDGNDQQSVDEAEQAKAEQSEVEDQKNTPESSTAIPELSDQPPDETIQANEQWLRRIPDNPGGLLKRKFQYQYRQRNRPSADETEAW